MTWCGITSRNTTTSYGRSMLRLSWVRYVCHARACLYLLTHTIIYTRTAYVCGCLAPHLSSDQYVWSTVCGAHTHTLKDAHVSNHIAMRIHTIKNTIFCARDTTFTYNIRRTSWLYLLHRTNFCRTTFSACISTIHYNIRSKCIVYIVHCTV